MFNVTQPFDFPAVSTARSQLWLPTSDLSACVRAVFSRDTRGIALTPAQRYNQFPVAPTCAINWYFSGDARRWEWGNEGPLAGPDLLFPGAITFFGPLSRPLVSWNSGPVHAMAILFFPDAFSLMTGIDAGAHIDQIVSADRVLDEE